MLSDVEEHALDASLMKVLVLPVGHDVAQQSFAVDAWATIGDQDAANVGLACDRAQAAQQVRVQVFGNELACVGAKELWCDLVSIAAHRHTIDAVAGQTRHSGAVRGRRLANDDVDICAGTGREVTSNDRCQVGRGFVPAHRKRAQVELQGLRFDEIDRICGDGNFSCGDLRHSIIVQPGQLPGIPDIRAMKWQFGCESKRVSGVDTCDRV